MNKQRRWRVRVIRQLEDWVEIKAETMEEANLLAAQRPGIVNVFIGSTISGEKPAGQVLPIGVADDNED